MHPGIRKIWGRQPPAVTIKFTKICQGAKIRLKLYCQKITKSIRIRNYELRSTNHGQRTTNYDLRTTNYKLRTTSYQLRTTNHQLPTTKYELQTTNYELQTTNYEPQTTSVSAGLAWAPSLRDLHGRPPPAMCFLLNIVIISYRGRHSSWVAIVSL